jgi:hypothetical protein
MATHPLLWLALATLLLVLVYAVWNLTATLRQRAHGNNVEGVGGPNDPLR